MRFYAFIWFDLIQIFTPSRKIGLTRKEYLNNECWSAIAFRYSCRILAHDKGSVFKLTVSLPSSLLNTNTLQSKHRDSVHKTYLSLSYYLQQFLILENIVQRLRCRVAEGCRH